MLSDVKKKEENNENNTKHALDTAVATASMLQHAASGVAAAAAAAAAVHHVHGVVQNHHQSGGGTTINIPQTHQQLSWSCELCGRMFGTRDEWSVHAKSHLEVSDSEEEDFYKFLSHIKHLCISIARSIDIRKK